MKRLGLVYKALVVAGGLAAYSTLAAENETISYCVDRVSAVEFKITMSSPSTLKTNTMGLCKAGFSIVPSGGLLLKLGDKTTCDLQLRSDLQNPIESTTCPKNDLSVKPDNTNKFTLITAKTD